MGFEILDSLDNLDLLWRYYWLMAVAVCLLTWLGIRRWLWWGVAWPLLGLVAGLAFTVGVSESGDAVPMAMLAALAFLNDPTQLPFTYIKPILLHSLLISGGLMMVQIAWLRHVRRKQTAMADEALDEDKKMLINRIKAFNKSLNE